MEPNILITNSCNQNCAFCFAKNEMDRPLGTSFMSLDQLKKLINRLKTISSSKSIKIMGGEPTLHPEFAKIINFSLSKYKSVQLFTNGVFPLKTTEFLKSIGNRMDIVFNVSTPGFQTNKKIRDLVLSNINELYRYNHVVLSLTYNNDRKNMLSKVPRNILKKVSSIRLGISNPQAQFSLVSYKKLGKKTLEYIKKIHAIDTHKTILLNCGYTPCMFTSQQMRSLLANNVLQKTKWSCFGKDSSYDVGIDGKAFSCFVHSEKKMAINTKTNTQLSLAKYLKKEEKTSPICKKCIYFMKECLGPCII